MDIRAVAEEALGRRFGELADDLAGALLPKVERLRSENSALAEELRQLRARLAARSSPPERGPTTQGAQAVREQPGGDIVSPNDGSNSLEEAQNYHRGTSCAADFTHAAQSKEVVYEGLYDITRAFRTLCLANENCIHVPDIVKMWTEQEGMSIFDPAVEVVSSRFSKAMKVLNREMCVISSNLKTHHVPTEIYLDAFILIMKRKEITLVEHDEETLKALSKIRDVLVKEDALRNIAQATQVQRDCLCKHSESNLLHTPNRMDVLLSYVDPIIGFVIILNAIVIFVSTDLKPNAQVWTYVEVTFTSVFMGELAIKLIGHGPMIFFTGPDMYWNVFDCIVVIIAGVDLIITVVGTESSLRNFTIVRLLRFARLTKLVRVLKLKMFKELTLMVNGILAGFRVLVWAIVFLAFILFALGVVLTQTVGQEDVALWMSLCDSPAAAAAQSACNSAQHFQRYQKDLFGNVPRSMFTVFRCFTDGCSSVDGTPLVPYFYNIYGSPVVMLYMVVILFVMFGLFNLIMAVFVENTIDNAKNTARRRREAAQQEHLRLAQKLQELIIMFCSTGDVYPSQKEPPRQRKRSRLAQALKRILTTRNVGDKASRVNSQKSVEEEVSVTRTLTGDGKRSLSLQVTAVTFNKLMESPDVQSLLDELDVVAFRDSSLFEILDANCNGTVEVSELVEGLLKLRGGDQKGDSVASLLAIRSMQKNIKALETLTLHQQQVIQGIAARQQRMQESLQASRLRTRQTDGGGGQPHTPGGSTRSEWTKGFQSDNFALDVALDSRRLADA